MKGISKPASLTWPAYVGGAWFTFTTADGRSAGEMVGDSDAKGWPDLTLIRDRILYREVKTEKGRVTKSQDRMIVSLLAAGGDAKVWRPSDWDEIQEVLSK